VTEGVVPYLIETHWVTRDGETVAVVHPEVGDPWYRLSGEALEALFYAAGYHPLLETP
jgi:hypothetical protein